MPSVEMPEMAIKSFTPSLRSSVFVRSLPIVGCYLGVGFLVRCLSYLSQCYPLLWSSCLVSFQIFFSGNYSICRCIFGVSVGSSEFRVLPWHCLTLSCLIIKKKKSYIHHIHHKLLPNFKRSKILKVPIIKTVY